MTDKGHVGMPFGVLPPPDVVDYLVGQHTQIRDLMATVLRSEGEQRRDAFRRVVHLLSVHETAEEEVVHPAARAKGDGAQLVADRLNEEHEAKQLLELLDGMAVDDPSFLPMFRRLREAMITHAVSEQRYEFNRLRQHVRPSQRAAMRALAQAAEHTAPTHPHAGVESAKANLLLGPPMAIMDRARDAIRRAREASPSGGEDGS